MAESRKVAPLRIVIFGATPPDAWLAGVAAITPATATIALRGAGAQAAVPADDARFIVLSGTEADDSAGALRAAAAQFPGDDLILLRAGVALPRLWYERLQRALAEDDVLVASPLDNADAARSPLPEGASSQAPARVIDALCYRHGRHQLLDWPAISPLVSAWSGARVQRAGSGQLGSGDFPEQLAPLRGVLLDHLYVADPERALRGPDAPAPDSDAPPASPLGELRGCLAAALAGDAAISTMSTADAYPGLDPKPVILHVLHGWGGGAERFVRDLAAADTARHHLVLTARGSFARRCYGEALELRDGALRDPPLRRLVPARPIRSTALADNAYAAFFTEVVRDFGVDAVVVSSLIGHSLDALRSGLPTLVIGHDYYPLWPLLHRDFGDANLAFDAAQLCADVSGREFEFAERDPRFWTTLREAHVAAVAAAGATVVAPSRSMLANLLRLEPRLAAQRHAVIAHGLADWPRATAIPPAPPRERLRLIVPGRVRAGKGAELLRAALAGLREHAEIFLLGAGAEAAQFFGESGVHVVLNYRRDELPDLIAGLAPDAALLLPTVAETFSYTLSELHSLGLPVIATRVGALAERVRDGVDGWLVAPNAADVVAMVARLRAARDAIERARAAVRQLPVRSLADMAADYRALLPLPEHAVARYALTPAGSDRLLALSRADEIGAARRAMTALRAEIREQQGELERRADWGISLERDVRRARDAVAARDADVAELRAVADWARGEIARLEDELDERTRWAKSLDADVESMRRSVSWRLTRPLRYALRKLRGARVRMVFTLQRLRSAARRMRGSLASRGLAGTVRRLGDEFRRGARPANPNLQVAEPAPDYAPFSLPCTPSAMDGQQRPPGRSPSASEAMDGRETPRVSIVIPVFNKIDYTIACLRSIAAHSAPVDFEVIVVDDASSDDTPRRLARVTGIRVMRNAQNLGFVGSCNAGAAAARGEYVLFLNNDTVVTDGWLGNLLRVFDDEPDAGLVGAKLVYPDGRLQEAGGIVFSDGSGWNYGRFDDPADPRYSFRREADYCSGAAIVLRRELFERLGGFDGRYAPAYYEDTDLAFAVRAAGLKVICEPRATVVHFEGVTAGTDTSSGMKRFQVVNRDKFLEKWKKELAAQPAPIHEARFAPAAANHRARGRILIVDSYTPTPDQDSGSLRMVALMRLLRELGYAVAFLPENRAHAGGYTEALQALGVEALYHPFVSDPVRWLREQGPTLDAIVLSRHYVAVNFVGPARLYAPQARLIFDTVDLHYLREERAAALEDKAELKRHAARTRTQELKLMRETDVTLVVSAAEKQLLEREVPGRRIEVLSNVHAIHGCRAAFAQRRDLVFVGGFQHPPNIDAVCWFVTEVMPLLRADADAPRLHVIGSKVPPSVLALAADDVTVHGYVADIAPFMDGCRLSVAPLRYGAGVKGKVNMAMSYGLPVVASSIAVEGMHVRRDVDVMVADTPDDFAAAIRRAYADAALWQQLSENGLANVREHFSFDAARTALARILPSPRAPR